MNGHESGEGAKLSAVVQHFWPELEGHLSRSWRAVAGWQKLAPSPPKHTRAPFQRLGLLAMVGLALHRDSVCMAFAMVLHFICYLGPSELISLTP